jgi:MFS family permease
VPPVPTPKSSRPTSRYANYVLAVMVIMYTCNYLDRFVLTMMISDIKADLQISDSMVGFIMGPAFALFYTIGGVPIARWADVGSRRSIISIGMVVWSGFTAASGLVTTGLQLATARVCVGVGEAAGAAPAHSLLSDYFPPEKRATALSFFQGGVYLGSMLGLLIGGLLVPDIGWRTTFLVVGLPGLLIALIVRFTVREPVRGQFDRSESDAAQELPTATILEVAQFLSKRPTFWFVAIGAGIASFAGTGYGMWMPTFLERVHDMPKAEIGVRFAIIQYVPAFFGAILNGKIADYLGQRDIRWHAWVGAIAVSLTIPFMALQLLWPDGREAIYWAIPSALCGAGWAPIAYGLAQNLAPPHMRAVASSFIIIFITFLGTGLGPWAVGYLNDILEPTYGLLAIRWSMLSVLMTCTVGAVLFALAARTLEEDIEAGRQAAMIR